MEEDVHVYDRAKFHLESVHELGLREDHAANHAVFFLRWLIDHKLVSDRFLTESREVLTRWRSGNATIYDVYDWFDNTLDSTMLTDEGNAFARSYFDFTAGRYLSDYMHMLGVEDPYLATYSDKNFWTLEMLINKRYRQWRRENGLKRKSWFRK